jgi:hypothetical protein
MAASTFYSTKAGEQVPVPSYPGGGVILSQYVTMALPETPEVGDVYKLFYLPEGAVPIGGYLATTDIDTGAETFDMDVGIDANGVDVADPDFFTNSGVLSGDAITDFPFTNAANARLFTGAFPVAQLARKTMVQAVVNAVAAGGGTGSITVRVDYLCPGKPTS